MGERELSQDLGATIAARRELGEQYESALVESFLEKVDREVDARVAAQLGGVRRPSPREPAAVVAPARRSSGSVMALGSVALGIPVTAIVSTQMHGAFGFLGLVVSWGAIAVVNSAHAFGRRR